MKETPTLLLVHGSWHGPWCWQHFLPALARQGIAAQAVSLPSIGTDPTALGTLPDDAAVVAAAAAAIEGDVVVLGHSYGGAVISAAALPDNVSRLVFLGAFMPDSGAPFVVDLPPGPLPPYVGLREDGTSAVPPGEALPAFYHDCRPEIVAWAEPQLRLQAQSVLGHVMGEVSWKRLPSSYIVLTDDRALPTEMQRRLASRASEAHEFASAHSPFLSRPDDLARLVAGIVSRPRLHAA